MLSTGGKNATLGAIKTALDGGFWYLFGGAIPADGDTAPASPTILAKVYGDGTSTGCTFQAAAGGVLAKTTAEPWGGPVLANGTVTFARYCHGGDDGTTTSATNTRMQATVGSQGSGADIGLDNTALLTSGSPVAIGAYQIRCLG